MKSKIKKVHFIYFLVAILTLFVAVFGLTYSTDGHPYEYVNQYGDLVKIWGNGLYANDSYFKAPIFRATDLTILILAVPLLAVALIMNIKRNSQLSKYFLCSVFALLLYYSASLAFGVTYNFLHLAYIMLFALSLFCFIISFVNAIPNYGNINYHLPYKRIYTFLSVSGIALIVAWLPDIFQSLINSSSLSLIENYTTEITYVLDMGIIAPVCFITIVLLRKKKDVAIPILIMLLIVCAIIGVMVCVQTIFQISAGIEISLPALITKVGIFTVLAIFSLVLLIFILRSLLSNSLQQKI